MGENKYVSTFPMASCNKKTCDNRKKRGVKKYENTQLFLQELRITRLRKYPIDPKAHLGRCMDGMVNMRTANFILPCCTSAKQTYS